MKSFKPNEKANTTVVVWLRTWKGFVMVVESRLARWSSMLKVVAEDAADAEETRARWFGATTMA